MSITEHKVRHERSLKIEKDPNRVVLVLVPRRKDVEKELEIRMKCRLGAFE